MDVRNTEYNPAYPVASLRKHESNKRQGDVGAIYTSIEANGFYGAVVVQASSARILAGNHRFDAALHAGAETIPVIFVDCDDQTALRILLADNRTNDLASYDTEGLAEILNEIQLAAGTLNGTGWDTDSYANLCRDIQNAYVHTDPESPAAATPTTEVSSPGTEPTGYRQADQSTADQAADEVVDKRDELLAKWQTARGQIWSIGQHRLIVGDSRKAEDIDALLNGEKASWVWTDPPYGVSYKGRTAAAMEIENDGSGDIDALLTDVFAQLARIMHPGAPIYVAFADKSGDQFRKRFCDAFHLHQTLIWVKNSIVLGHADYHFRHEPILYGWKENREERVWAGSMYPHRPWFGERTKSTVIEVPKPSRSDLHPTTKPTGLIVHCLLNSSAPGSIGIDPFAGSGATLLAAEECSRVAFCSEIDPKYAAVILERASIAGLTCHKVAG